MFCLNGSKSSFLMAPGKILKHLKADARTLGGFCSRSVHVVSSLDTSEETCSLIASADSRIVTKRVSIVADLTLGSGRSRDCKRRGRILPNSVRITVDGTLRRMLERAMR